MTQKTQNLKIKRWRSSNVIQSPNLKDKPE